jgi:outer membrane protein assembly factor BamA
MRWVLAQNSVLAAVAFFALPGSICGQETLSSVGLGKPCLRSDTHDKAPTVPEISIVDVELVGAFQLPVSDQTQIVTSVKQATRGTSLDDVRDEGVERITEAWQDRGYFKARVTGETRTLGVSPESQRIALSVQVEEGLRYNLKDITFKNNKAIVDVDTLRGFFQIADGEVFSREKIAKGLDDLRRAYGEIGFINFTSVPDTQFDDESGLISLVIDLDEGKQFRTGSVKVLGLDEVSREEMLKALPKRGEIFSSKIWEQSLVGHLPMLPDCGCGNVGNGKAQKTKRIDESTETVSLTFDFRPCSAR